MTYRRFKVSADIDTDTPATAATVATVQRDAGKTVATVAAVATGAGPAEVEERAALIEAGGLPRAWAEGLAKLTSGPPPEAWGPDWALVRDGLLRFADRLAADPWAAKALRMGWTATDLFGVHPRAPGARMDCRGAATFIADAKIIALMADEIAVETPAGRRLRITKPINGGVPLWEIV